MPAITDEQLENWFQYHPTPLAEGFTVANYEAINAGALAFAKILRDNSPACADQSSAIRHIRMARMEANAAIYCGGK